MSMNQPKQNDGVTAEEVADFLRANPEFFLNQRALLAELSLPHASGRTISLVERQVDILRERNVDMRRRMNELLATARTNDDLFSKTRSLTLALLDLDNLQALNEALATHVLVDFDADFVAVHISQPPRTEAPLDHIVWHSSEARYDAVRRHLHGEAPTCSPLREEELAHLFPMARHDGPGSAVLIPLRIDDVEHAALTIGSRDGNRFSANMDTLFVGYIADVLERVTGKLLGGA